MSQEKYHNTSEKALVIGAGSSGRAAVRLLCHLGIPTTLLECTAIAEDFRQEAEKAGVVCIIDDMKPEYFVDISLVIPSPGVRIADIKKHFPVNHSIEIVAEMELAWRNLQGEPVLAVTGSSGKTTTVSLAAAMLEADGKKVFLGGNIGTPLSEYVLESKKSQQKADVIVLEVSSFQLQGCKTYPPHVAELLKITENHLDYHADLQEYIDAKMQLFAAQTTQDMAIFHQSLASLTEKRTIQAQMSFFEKDAGNFPQKELFGAHNGVNIEAAWLACKAFGVQIENARKAVAAFKPLPHRLEKVRELDGVLYVNDSKCTTVDAMRVALQAFDAPIFLLCGGKFKGGDLPSLRPLITEKVKSVIMFGASREYFEKAWADIVPMHWFSTLQDAILEGKKQARAGDVVLMAPATASFDLYPNYIARGEDFKTIVETLV